MKSQATGMLEIQAFRSPSRVISRPPLPAQLCLTRSHLLQSWESPLAALVPGLDRAWTGEMGRPGMGGAAVAELWGVRPRALADSGIESLPRW